MSTASVIVLGGTGLIGSAVCRHFEAKGYEVLSVNSKNYAAAIGKEADLVINCNGNSFRYKANQEPRWDFEASVATVERSLFDFKFNRYFYFSTIDVYSDLGEPSRNHEESVVEPRGLHAYGFHKWLAERLVERFAESPLILRTGTVVGAGMTKGPLLDLVRNEPIHMAQDSELSLIDTEVIAGAAGVFADSPPSHRIINLTGTGAVSLRALCERHGLAPRAAPGAERVRYRYDINNERLREIYRVPSSKEAGEAFLAIALSGKV